MKKKTSQRLKLEDYNCLIKNPSGEISMSWPQLEDMPSVCPEKYPGGARSYFKKRKRAKLINNLDPRTHVTLIGLKSARLRRILKRKRRDERKHLLTKRQKNIV